MNTITFDVFDTLITRKVAHPHGIFTLMEEKLLCDAKYSSIPNFIKENFKNYRVSFESYQRTINSNVYGLEEITFDEIYLKFKDNFNLSDEQINSLKDLELETELDNILPIKKNIDLARQYLSDGKNVFLISDMYLSSEFIKKLLCKAETGLENLELCVSCEYQAQKATGKLYEKIRDLKELNVKDWEHYGDNYYADVKKAKSIGIKGVYLPTVNLEDYEKIALNLNTKYSQLVVGCSKYTITNGNNSEYYDLGASLAAPILLPYVLWLLEQSKKLELNRLYFIARDGYILKKMADIIIKKENLNIRTKYLYGSRIAWRSPSLAINDKNIDNMIKAYGGGSGKNLAKDLDVDVTELKSLLPRHLLKRKSWNYKSKIDMVEELRKDGRLYTYLKNINKPKADILKEFIKQEIDLSDDKFAFVDVNGSGATLNSLTTFYKDSYENKTKVFFMQPAMNIANVFDNLNGYWFINKTNIGEFVELLTRAPHGLTIGYKKVEDRIEPILEEMKTSFDFENYIAGIIDFTKNYLDFKLSYNLSVLNIYLDYAVTYKDPKIAEAFGRIPYSCAGKNESEYAPKISTIDIIKYLLGFSLKTNNRQLSYARSSHGVKFLFDLRQKIKKNIKKLFSTKKSKK